MSRRKRSGYRKVEQQTCCFELLVLRQAVMYVFTIDGAEPFFRKFDPSPVWEHLSVKIAAEVVEPAKFKRRRISLSIHGDRDITDCMRWGSTRPWEPKAIGALDIRGRHGSAYCCVPHDALPIIIASLELARSRRIDLTCETPHYGKGKIYGLHVGSDEGIDEAWEPGDRKGV